MGQKVWVVLSTRQVFNSDGEVNSRAHVIIFTLEEKARVYAARLKEHNPRWEVGVGEIPILEDPLTAPLPEPDRTHKEN